MIKNKSPHGGIDIKLKEEEYKRLFSQDTGVPEITNITVEKGVEKSGENDVEKVVEKAGENDVEIDTVADIEKTNMSEDKENKTTPIDDENISTSIDDEYMKEIQSDDKPIIDRWDYSEENLDNLIEEYKKQQEWIGERQKELRADFANWKKEAEKELEKQNLHITTKQDLIQTLEKMNKQLEDDLSSKIKEYEQQTVKLIEERKNLKAREIELETKVDKYENKSKEFNTKLMEIDVESSRLEAERVKLMEAQKEFASQVSEFEGRIREKINLELNKELEGSQAELEYEWAVLREEQDKLGLIYQDMLLARDKFQEKVERQSEELRKEREQLDKEWDQIKKVRKNLDLNQQELGSEQYESINSEHLKEVDDVLKARLEDQMLADLEGRVREEINEQVQKDQDRKRLELEGEWEKLRTEQDRLVKIRDEILQTKKIKIKENFENKIMQIKKLFKKNKYKKEDLDKLETELRSEVERKLKELDDHEDKREELDQKAKELEEQQIKLEAEREELSEEWKYIMKEKKKFEENRIKIDGPLHVNIEENLNDDISSELNIQLEELQTQLKKELSELRSHHEKFKEAQNQFLEAKCSFEIEHDIKSKRFKPIPISKLDFSKLF